MRDLSLPVSPGMTVYPGDPEVRCTSALDLATDGVAVTDISLGSHTGTHLDAPAHRIPGGRTTGELGLDELVGEALVVHLAGDAANRGGYGLGDLDTALAAGLPDRLPAIVVIDTGMREVPRVPSAPPAAPPTEALPPAASPTVWASATTNEPPQYAALDPIAAAELVRRGMRVLAVDTPSPDPMPAADGALPVHDAVLGADRLIVENLTNLAGLPERVRVGFFPLPIDADGAPVRAIAFD